MLYLFQPVNDCLSLSEIFFPCEQPVDHPLLRRLQNDGRKSVVAGVHRVVGVGKTVVVQLADHAPSDFLVRQVVVYLQNIMSSLNTNR